MGLSSSVSAPFPDSDRPVGNREHTVPDQALHGLMMDFSPPSHVENQDQDKEQAAQNGSNMRSQSKNHVSNKRSHSKNRVSKKRNQNKASQDDDVIIFVEERRVPSSGSPCIVPVLPGSSGEGLPYAPADWPSPGDVWRWKVGKRYNSSGYFMDRFVFPPRRLMKNEARPYFGGKGSLEDFMRRDFPCVDVDAFFASFTWKVPVKLASPTRVEAVSHAQDKTKKGENTSSIRRKRKQKEAVKVHQEIAVTPSPTPRKGKKTKVNEVQEENEETLPSPLGTDKTADILIQKTGQPSVQDVPSTATDGEEDFGQRDPAAIDQIPEDFDKYLNMLEDILTQPPSGIAVSSATSDSLDAEVELTEARQRLSSLLVMDFPSLVLSKNLAELTTIASKLLKYPRLNLNAKQCASLKLIEEIPQYGKVFLESRETVEQVDKNFAKLEAAMAKANTLKSKYNELKEKADQIQLQIDSSLLAVQEMDKQIAQLQAKRAELSDELGTKMAAKIHLHSAQKVLANSIQILANVTQSANSGTAEWQLKKTNAEKLEAEILEKFGPLQGFSL